MADFEKYLSRVLNEEEDPVNKIRDILSSDDKVEKLDDGRISVQTSFIKEVFGVDKSKFKRIIKGLGYKDIKEDKKNDEMTFKK